MPMREGSQVLCACYMLCTYYMLCIYYMLCTYYMLWVVLSSHRIDQVPEGIWGPITLD